MGVDFYACENCADTFPDCGPHYHCECGRVYCSEECADAKYNVDEDGDEEDQTCAHCRGETADDSELLTYLLSLSGLSKTELLAQYLKEAVSHR
jgi:hypothetical protein